MGRNWTSYEACLSSYRATVRNSKTNKAKLAAGEIDEAWLEQEAVRQAATAWARQVAPPSADSPDEWDAMRDRLMQEYQSHSDFDSPAAKGQLASIVRLEVEQAKLERQLADPQMSDRSRDALLDNLRKMADTHRALVVAAGLDRRSAEDRKENLSPIEKWETQMARAHLYMAWRYNELQAGLAGVASERDLRELLKYRLSGDFYDLWDPVLVAHRRVLGLPHADADLERYD